MGIDARRLPLIAVTLTVVLYLAPLSLDAPLTDPDEGLHAAISQEMLERGESVSPRFLGEAFLDKPILFFWSQMASMRVFGMTTAAARLPGMLFAVLGIAATGWFARLLFGPTTGWFAVLCYATMALPFMLAQAPVHDMALVPLVVSALACLWLAHGGDSGLGIRDSNSLGVRRWESGVGGWWLGVAGIALGLSILTKGLEGVAIVGVGYTLYLALTGGITWKMVARGAVVLIVAALVAMPWYVAMAAREPGYLQYYFVERHFLGFATDTQRHGGQPFWFYLPLVIFGGLPWLLYISLKGLRSREARAAGSPELLVVTWLVASVALLSLSGSKASTYVLPVMPAVAILAARSWGRLAAGAEPALETRIHRCALAHAAVMFMVTALSPWAASRYGDQPVASGEALVFGIVSVLWLRLLMSLRKTPAADAWFGLAGLTGMTYAFAFVLFGPALAEAHSARDVARYFDRVGTLPDTIYVMDGRVSFVYYLQPEIRRQLRDGQIKSVSVEQLAALPEWPRSAVLTLPADLAGRLSRVPQLNNAIGHPAGRYLVIAPEGQLPTSNSQLPSP